MNVLAQYGYTGQPINALDQASFGPTGWDRDTILPFARRVEDGSVVRGGGIFGSDWHFAVPQAGADVINAIGAVGGSPMAAPARRDDATREHMVNTAGAVVGPMAAGGYARNALAPRGGAELGIFGGHLDRAPLRIFRGDSEFGQGIKGQYWGSTSPDVAAMYANAGKGGQLPQRPTITEAEARFKNPLVVDAGGALFSEIPATPATRRMMNDGGATHSIDDLAFEARHAGHDGLVVRNVMDGPGYADAPEATTVAALRRGTVFDPRTGQLIFSSGFGGLPYDYLSGEDR